MNSIDYMSLKRRSSWQSDHNQEMMMIRRSLSIGATSGAANNNGRLILPAGLLDRRHEDPATAVVPAVTVVLEGRSICHRISLDKHASYHSLAKALRQMFAGAGAGEGSGDDVVDESSDRSEDLDLSNAVPGHLVAYEDIENDLLLAGDLNWKDFVRVAKRIRILPAKSNSRKPRSEPL